MSQLSDGSLRRLRDLIDLPDLTGTQYRMIRPIASGGMGSVYLVEDTKLNRGVALKVLSTPLEGGQVHARMMREARVVAMLEHPAIVPIHDVGILADGRPYYVMKHVQGVTLPEHLKACSSLAERLVILQKLCQAVAFAHSHGVIHRDLKPDNIMVGPFGEVLVMDWGTAKSDKALPVEGALTKGNSALDVNVTSEGVLIGTPAFMSPEQAMGDSVLIDERSDVFGLGAILYFMVTGHPPYKADKTEFVRESAIHCNFPRVRTIDPSIPKAIEAVCIKAMARERADRYRSVLELETDLSRFMAGEPVSAYHENLVERLMRFLRKYQFIVVLVVVYIVLRAVVFFWLGH